MVSEQLSHYRIIEKLGAGGMGEVFLAQDLTLDRRVAIKILHAKSIENEQAKKRLLREAKAAATLDHPNICTIHEVNEEADSPFIVMQYIDGVTLWAKLQAKPLPPTEVINIGIQAAEALAEAHSRGVVHRDIKPQNVMITPRGQVKILDFGLAKQTLNTRPTDPEAKTETRLTEDGQIVVLGGLLQEGFTNDQEKVPVLGDAPFFGNLFRYDTRKRTKTNLMIFLRPTVIRSPAQSVTLSNERYRALGMEQQAVTPESRPMLPDMTNPTLPLGTPVGPRQ